MSLCTLYQICLELQKNVNKRTVKIVSLINNSITMNFDNFRSRLMNIIFELTVCSYFDRCLHFSSLIYVRVKLSHSIGCTTRPETPCTYIYTYMEHIARKSNRTKVSKFVISSWTRQYLSCLALYTISTSIHEYATLNSPLT